MSHIGGDWYKDVDVGSGTPYYTNYSTGEVTWNYPTDLPEPATAVGSGSEGKWVETLDEHCGAYYYLHSVTGESRWDNPNAVGESGVEDLNPADDPANWTSGVDESSGYTYYYNKVTEVNQWEPPVCMVTQTTENATPSVEPVPTMAEAPAAPVAPTLPGKKASISPPSAPSSAKKSSPTPPPAPSPAKRASVAPPAPPAPSRKVTTPLPTTPGLSKPKQELESPKSTQKKNSSFPPVASSTKNSTKNSSDLPVANVTEDVKTLGLRAPKSKQASFATLHALDEAADEKKEEEEEVDGGGSDSEMPSKRPELLRDPSAVMTAPPSSAIGHRVSTIQMLPSSDEPTTHDLCQQVFDVTFQQYGEKNYNFERKGIFKGRTTIEKMTTWKPDLIKTSLRTLSASLSSEAVQLFKNITGFMGDRATSKDPVDHAVKILNQVMLAPEELRDELYCQLCKQTNGNPSPESTERGWQFFMISLATVPPSFSLMPHLMAYFVENLTHNIPNCAKYAELCLHKCPKICKLGARREIPTRMELETIRRGGLMTVRVFFLDGKYTNMRADSWTTVRELEAAISKLLKIQNDEPFSLCEVSSTEEERVPDPDERILDIISFWDRTANEASAKGSAVIEEFCFQYKVGLFYDIEDTDLPAIELLYIQATHDIVDSRYPCSEQDSITLAALQMQEEYGDYPGAGKCTYLRGNLGKYLAARLIQQAEDNPTKLEEKIYALYAKLTAYSQLEARLSYLDYVKSWKIYGSTYFFVEPQNVKDLPKECVLAVNNKGVTVISPTTKEYLAEYNYSTVITWGHSPNSFVLVTGTQTRQVKVYFKTEQGKELNNMLKCYIDHRKR